MTDPQTPAFVEPELPDDDELELEQLLDDDLEDPEPEPLGRLDIGAPGRPREAQAAGPDPVDSFRAQLMRTRL